MKRIIILSVATLALSGCGIHTKYKPAGEVPGDLYGQSNSAAADTSNFGNLGWREVFKDSRLQALVDTGLQRNVDLQTAHLRVKEAEASLMAAKLSFLPSLSLAPEGSLSSFDHSSASKTYTLPVAASWEIDVFGKLANVKRSSKAAYLQSKEYEQAVRTQLIAGIANSYYTLLMLDAQLEITEATEQNWKQSVEVTRAMKMAGMVTEAALAQTEANYYNIHTTVLDLKEQINQTENSLCLLLADVPHKISRGKLGNQQMPEQFSVGIPVQMLSNRPDVKSAELSLAQAFYGTNAARSAFYPSLNLGGTLGWTNAAGSAIVNPGKLITSAFASLAQPLFNRGKNIAQLKIAKAQQEEAQLAFQQTLLSAGSEVNNALVQYQTAQGKSGYYTKQITSLESATRSTQLLMKHGTTTYLEVLTAQQSLLNAQLTQVANRFTEIQGVINLYQALGGGRM